MTSERTHRAGGSVEDHCRACKTDRLHTVIAADGEGRAIRVACGYCHSEHNYRGGPKGGGVWRTCSCTAWPARARHLDRPVSDRQ